MGRMGRDERAFDEFVRARLLHLLRLGRALTGSDREGGALVTEALAAVLARWDESSALTAEDDVRQSMVARYRHNSKVQHGHDDPDVERDQEVWDALGRLAPRVRAEVALRLLDNVSDGQDASLPGFDDERVRRALHEPVTVDQARLLDLVRQEAARRTRRRRQIVTVVASAALACVVVLVVLAVLVVLEKSPITADSGTDLSESVYAFAAAGPTHVWAISLDPDCPDCSMLWAGDGTSTGWRKVHDFDQAALFSQLRMAPNGLDGFAWFGRDWLQATHDGGKTWVVPGVDLREGEVDVRIAGETVYVLLPSADGSPLYTAEIGSDEFTEVDATFPPGSGSFLVPLGDRMFVLSYLVDGATLIDVATTERHVIPCEEPLLPPRSSGGALFATCPDHRQRGTVAVLRSVNGHTWEQLGRSERTRFDTYPVDDERTFVITSEGGRIVERSAQIDVPIDIDGNETITNGQFVTPEVGFLLTDSGRLLRSEDGGESWEEIS